LEKLIKESGDKMKEDDKKELETKLEDLKKAKDSEKPDTEDLKKKMEEVNAIAQKIGTAMYQQEGAQAQGGAEGAEGAQADQTQANEEKKEEGPVEGEYEEGEKKDDQAEDKKDSSEENKQ